MALYQCLFKLSTYPHVDKNVIKLSTFNYYFVNIIINNLKITKNMKINVNKNYNYLLTLGIVFARIS